MTKKDFEMVADVIKEMPSCSPNLRAQKESVARSFAERFAQINPRFNLAIFAKACGLELYQGPHDAAPVIVYKASDYQ